VSSLNQIDANRRNALLSTGPKTTEGKAAARFNAIQSGIHAVEQIIPGEDPEAFQSFAANLSQSCRPVGAREQELVGLMTAHAWRLRRLLKAEPQIWERLFKINRMGTYFSEDLQLGDAFEQNPELLLRLQRLIASIQKSYRDAAADLDRLQANRAKSQPNQPLPLQQPTPEIGFVPSAAENQPGEASDTTPALSPCPSAPIPAPFEQSTPDLAHRE